LQDKSRVERTHLEDEQWELIDEVKDKNKEELAKMIETGMESKGQLTEVTGDFKTRRTKKESSEKDSQEKQSKLNDMTNITAELRQQIQSYKTELKEREQTMQDKEANIYELKKKTQELEKFKFVLDYKIKELKRDIGPREDDIQKL
jgi:chromosome segregation ATPase